MGQINLRVLGICLLLLFSSGAFALAAEKPNIVFITLDTLRPDHLGCYGFNKQTSSNIDSLAQDAILFSRAVTPIPATTPSHASIFSGLYPRHHQVLQNNGQLKIKQGSLAEILAKNGYNTAGFVSISLLDKRTKLDRGFIEFADKRRDGSPIRGVSKGKRAEETVDQAIGWLDRDQKAPVFVWLHLFDPHWPYSPPEKYLPKNDHDAKNIRRLNALSRRGLREIASCGLDKVDLGLSAEDKQLLVELYDAEITYMDAQLGRLFSYLKANDLYNDSIIIFLADHGELVGDRSDFFGHRGVAYDQALKVPLLIKLPTVAPKKINKFVRTIDVMPTLLAYLAITDPDKRDGEDLLPLIKGQAKSGPEFSFIDGLPNVKGQKSNSGVMTAQWKYWSAKDGEYLFDLLNDPRENNNLAEKMPDKVKELRSLSEVYVKNAPTNIKQQQNKLDKEQLQELKSLGYL